MIFLGGDTNVKNHAWIQMQEETRNNTHKEKSAESADLGRFQVSRGILASSEMNGIGYCCSGPSLCHIRK